MIVKRQNVYRSEQVRTVCQLHSIQCVLIISSSSTTSRSTLVVQNQGLDESTSSLDESTSSLDDSSTVGSQVILLSLIDIAHFADYPRTFPRYL